MLCVKLLIVIMPDRDRHSSTTRSRWQVEMDNDFELGIKEREDYIEEIRDKILRLEEEKNAAIEEIEAKLKQRVVTTK